MGWQLIPGLWTEESDDDDIEEDGVPCAQEEGLKLGEAEAQVLPAADQPLKHADLVPPLRVLQAHVEQEGVQQEGVSLLAVSHDSLGK